MTAISIIIPLYNKSRYIKETITGFRQQLGQCDEIIVIDDVSTDDSLLQASTLASPQIRILESTRNSGPADARNAAAAAASGTHLLFFDADDIPHPDVLAILRQVIATHPGERLFCFDLAFEAHGEANFRQAWKNLPSSIPVKVLGQDAFVASALRGKPLCTASSTCVEKSAFKASGGFMPGLRYCEDPELWARLSADHRLVQIQLQLAIYRDVAQSLSYGHRMQPGAVQPYVNTLLKLGESRGTDYCQLAQALIVKNTFFSVSMGGNRRALSTYLRQVRPILPRHWFWLLRFIGAMPRGLMQFAFASRDYLRKRKASRAQNSKFAK